jgi:hypothetical protein
MSSLRWFVRENGYGGFLKQGLIPEVMRATLARGIKFTGLNPIHNAVFGGEFKNGSIATKGFAGSMSTIAEIVVCSPFENVKLAEQLAKDPALKIPKGQFQTSMGIARHLIRQGGAWSLWTGYAGMQGRQMLWSGVYFATVDSCKTTVNTASPYTPTAINNLVGGFLAGSFAALFSCPLDVCRTSIQKMQLSLVFQPGSNRSTGKMTFWDVTGGDCSRILHEGKAIVGRAGLGGLWAGIGPKMAYLGGGGAILAWIMPVLKHEWFAMQGIDPDLQVA